MSGRASELCLRALGNMAPWTVLPDVGAKGLCGRGASESVGGGSGGVIAGGCAWQGRGESRLGRAVAGRGGC